MSISKRSWCPPLGFALINLMDNHNIRLAKNIMRLAWYTRYMNISKTFDQTLNSCGISGKWLAERSGVSEVVISRFRRGRQVQTDTLGRLLVALPFEAQKYFFESLLGTNVKARPQSLQEMVEEMEPQALAGVLLAIAGSISPKTSKSTDQSPRGALL